MFKRNHAKIVREFARVVADGDGDVRDMSELPKKKEILEKSLLGVLMEMRDAPQEQLDALKLTFLALADFQQMTNEQVEARRLLSSVNDENFENHTFEQVEKMGSALELLQPLRMKSTKEYKARVAFLESLGV